MGAKVQQKEENCPYCGETAREEEYEQIPSICCNCGLVLYSDVTTQIEADVKLNDKKASQKCAWSEYVSITNSTEKQIAIALDCLEKISPDLHLSSDIRLEVARQYGKLSLSNFTRGRETESVVGAIVYLTARENNAAIPISRVSDVLGVSRSLLNRLVRQIQVKLEIGHGGCQPVDYLDFLCKDLNIEGEQKDIAESVLEAFQESSQTKHGSPVGTACAVLYSIEEKRIPQRVYASAGGISQETLRVHLKQLREIGFCD